MNLADWLLEQIAADEEAARAALRDVDALPVGATIFHRADLAHIARWDPARVLAECAAKRQIVENLRHAQVLQAGLNDLEMQGYIIGVTDALKALAQPYRDRPGFLDDWRLA